MMFIKLLLVFISLSTFAQYDWRGHNRALVNDFQSINSQFVLNHRSILIYEKDQHQFEFAYELFALENDYENSLYANANEPSYKFRVKDLNYYLTNDQIIQNLDRAVYRYSQDKVELNLGRQIISHGSARTINPLDILVPHDLLVVNSKQRDGVDAIRSKISFSPMGVIDFGLVTEEDVIFKREYKFFSMQETFGPADIRLLYQTVNKHNIYGIDIQASVGEWGAWLEAGSFQMNQQESFSRVSLGGQYHYANDLDFFFEYHFNGADKIIEDVSIFLNGKNYLNVGFAYPLNPLNNIKTTLYNNLNDDSSLLSFAYERSLKENLTFEASFIYGGLRGENTSEFQLYPQTVSISLGQYF